MSRAAEILASLSPAEAEQLLRRLRGKEREEAAEVRLEVSAESGPAPLAFAQERLWMLDRLSPGRSTYNLSSALVIRGRLAAAALRQALDEVVRRHGALRTRFEVRQEGPVQVVLPDLRLRLPVVDGSGLNQAAWLGEAQRLVEQEGNRPFDLARAPLLRAFLLRRTTEEHVFLLTVHHIVADGWSLDRLVAELAALYATCSRGEPSPLPELTLQYADYARWQRRRLQGALLEEQLAYWRGELADAPQLLEIPADRPRPAVASDRGGNVAVVIARPLGDRLAALGRSSRASLFTVLLAGFQALLYRYSGSADVVVGSPVAGRDRTELEPLIGMFANMLVLRIRLGDAPSFAALVERARDVVLGAQAHQQLPFERLVEELRPERSLSYNPLFQVVFAFQRRRPGVARLGDLTLEAFASQVKTTRFDLLLDLTEGSSGLHGFLQYSRDLFEPATLRRMAGHLERLLAEVAADPTRSIALPALLSDAERQQLLSEWNDSSAGCCALPAGVREAVEAQIERRGDALAAACSGRHLSYGELGARAERIAIRLADLGVGPGGRVGVLAPRSLEMLVAILGAVKAGGAYLPLDPSYPDERLALLLDDAQATAILCEVSQAVRIPAGPGGIAVLSIEESAACGGRGRAPLPRAGDGDLAYVIYTSGSTGRPKGVELAHHALKNLVAWHLDAFRVGPQDRATQIAAPGFDAAVWEVWPCLAAGASLVVPDEETRSSPAALVRWLTDEQITQSFLPTPLAEAVLAEQWPSRAALRVLLTGGDRLGSLPPRGLPFPLYNHYGPTENAVVATWAAVRVEGPSPPPIGRPIANVQAHVLDAGQSPVPIGVPGELFLAGGSLARGYLGRPEWTAERFVPDPFSPRPGGRLYRTGDRVRHLYDGQIEFLGRLDQQVKVRGFRIELGEIEAALTSEPGVRDAVAVVQERNGERRLVAYAVLARPLAPSLTDLRSALARKLPPYMVPTTLIALDAVPLTPHGKVDRRALPMPEWRRETRTAAPRTPVEELLCGVFQGVLGVAQVGVSDNFFEIGGQSLLATRVTARLARDLEVELPLRALFEQPSVHDLAPLVERALGGDPAGILPAVEPAPRGERTLSFGQERLWFLDRMAPGSAGYNVPLVVRLEGALDRALLVAVFSEIVRRHEVLRSVFREVEGRPVPVVMDRVVVPLPVADLQGLPPEERQRTARRLCTAEARRPFDLGSGPLLRLRLLRLSEQEHWLAFNIHHIACDGWSMEVLLHEQSVLYRAFGAGCPSPLAELPIQYADFAAWHRRLLQGARLDQELAWWRQALDGSPRLLELPTDRPRPAVLSSVSSRRRRRLPPGLAEGLGRWNRGATTTSFMSLLTAWSALMGRWTGMTDVIVGSPVSGRTRPELEALVGFFVNTLALRIDLSGNPGFQQLAARARERVLSAHAHQDLPFDRLVAELEPQRSLAHTPLFQVMLVLDQSSRRVPPERRLAMEVVELPRGAADFDLILTAVEKDRYLALELEYHVALFDAATIERLLNHFEGLLGEMLARPALRISDFSLLTAAERHQIEEEWSQPPSGELWQGSIVPILLASMGKTPDSIALVFGDAALSYGELHRRSSRLAWRLQEVGVGPEAVVGLLVERSPEMVMALLGILSAGGTYLPLDGTLPAERLKFLVADAGARVLVTRASSVLPAGLSSGMVILEVERALRAGPGPRPADPPIDPEWPAYVIYTSGSTGTPKGVRVNHGSLVTFAKAALGMFGLARGDRALQFASLSFDASLEEILTPLTVGATVVLRTPGMIDTPERFLGWCRDQQITALFLATAYWHVLAADMDESGAAVPESVSMTVIGGEAAQRHWLRTWARGPGRGRLVNTYGPTECTVAATQWTLRADEMSATDAGILPIGRAILGRWTYVLDPGMQSVPVGVIGELYLGGTGVAQGYAGRPALTAERFVPTPFSGRPGDRLYRTGDRVRLLPDGAIDFLGRFDDQIKIRGFRIELGEIEAALTSQAAIREAVVLPVDLESDPWLAAYLVPAGAVLPSPAEVKAALVRQLPAYMVPTVYVFVDALPRTGTGKVDRRALPAPRRSESAQPILPRSRAEEALCRIFQEVLGVERVGVSDDFFELGGHSLLATRVVSRLSRDLGVEIPLRTLFETPSAEDLAPIVEMALERAGGGGLPLEPVARDGELALSWAQRRLWFVHQSDPTSPAYNIPHALRMRGDLRVWATQDTLDEIVRRHEVLRTRFDSRDGAPVQVVDPPVRRPLGIVDLGRLSGEDREREALRLTHQESRRPFDLACDPMLRHHLLRLAADDHVMLWTLHHIVTDGWSSAVLVRELTSLYEAFVRGEPSPLTELRIQYADFSAWQVKWMSTRQMEEDLQYWARQLAGLLPKTVLPTDRPRLVSTTDRGDNVAFRLSAQLSGKLQDLAKGEGCTLFMVLTAALQLLIFSRTGNEDVLIGTEIANRNRKETEDLVGFFVNLLALRTDLSGNPTFRELLARVREVTLAAYAHQDLPFDYLLQELQLDRRAGTTGPFQVMFVLENAPQDGLSLPGLSLEQLSGHGVTAKFDLLLAISETSSGLSGVWNYRTDLFDRATIRDLAEELSALLERAAGQPDARLARLRRTLQPQGEQNRVLKQEKQARLSQFLSSAPEKVNLSSQSLIRTETLPGTAFPLVVRPAAGHLDLTGWVRDNRQLVEEQLLRHGAVLFRGFQVGGVPGFESFAQALIPELYGEYGDLPHEPLGGRVYRSTPYPPDRPILLHNESSQTDRWPLKQCFLCVTPPREGGETPVADCRELYRRLDPRIREPFESKGLLYVRNFTDGLDVSWQDFFKTDDRARAEELCHRTSMELEWTARGLRTRKRGPGVAKHPKTGETVFFNQVQAHHIACVDPSVRQALESLFAEEDLPRNVYFGDGMRIPDAMIQEIVALCEEAAIKFPWQQEDVLLVDNMLVAHGRSPFAGERKIVVAMGEMVASAEMEWQGKNHRATAPVGR